MGIHAHRSDGQQFRAYAMPRYQYPAQRKRQRLIGREVAEFSGQSGISRGALGTSTGGQY